ncbi:MAG TPA: hypothetical protein VKU82_02575 [Planctomycetaceae bacterium]|nr:hypothetical protein [Planctomycetaceae bacterium]
MPGLLARFVLANSWIAHLAGVPTGKTPGESPLRSMSLREYNSGMSKKKMILVAVISAIVCPCSIACLRFYYWQKHEQEISRNIARSKASAERGKYIAEFLDALNGGIRAEPRGISFRSRGLDDGDKLVARFREHWDREHRGEVDTPERRREALTEYLMTPDARGQAARIGVPSAVLPIAAEHFRPFFWKRFPGSGRKKTVLANR